VTGTGSREAGRIVVDGVWKKFQRGERHDSLRDLIPNTVGRLLGRRRDPLALRTNDFWALKNIGFEVLPGQALGIIGHNGAGKSTLLKLLTRILRPTLGRIQTRGRIGALIEIAAGFHPDLTGRENVFLQGAIMGMPAATIRRRFDEIVEFSGISTFIDTPVKRYSSGMNARLGFSIAAHLEPDVLIIDEVLSVGDLAFQERAFGRMKDVVRSGIPVAVVSHQLDRVRTLCTDAILLESGEIVKRGTAAECIASYVQAAAAERPENHTPIPGLTFGTIAILGEGGIRSGERRVMRLTGQRSQSAAIQRFELSFQLRSLESGQVVYRTWSHHHGAGVDRAGYFEFLVDLQFNLPPGLYSIETWAGDAERDERLGDGPSMRVAIEPGPTFRGQAQMNPVMTLRQGCPADPSA